MLNYTNENDTYELRELAGVVRKFATSTLTSSEFERSDFSKMATLGLSGITISENFGGNKLSPLDITAAIFELARVRMGPAIYLSVHSMVSAIIQNGATPSVSAALLPELASAKKLGAFCLTEANAGSDASAIRTKAELKDNKWVINGEKIYITSGPFADIYLVFAKTNVEKKEISAFIVSKDSPGISSGNPEPKMGCESSPISSVTLENCTIPKDHILGETGEGYKIALSALNSGRVNVAAAACGIASKAIEISSHYACERKQFDKTISKFQAIQFMLADMVTKFRASVLLTRSAAMDIANGSSAHFSASAAKCFATDSAMEITTEAVQILGGAGYLKDYKIEKLMRDAKMLQIVEGTNQIQRILIARELLGKENV